MKQVYLLLNIVLPFLLSPLLLGIINRVKAVFAGRTGQPLFQPYFDVWKLLHKDFTYSRTTTWIFRTAPSVGLVCTAGALCFLSVGMGSSFLSFQGDFLLLIYLLGIARFFMVIAALDTGSSFEGMGASREVQYSALVEPTLFTGVAALACTSHNWMLSGMFSDSSLSLWNGSAPQVLLVGLAFFILLLVENCRIPVDDPNTHLELTMIHEVMVLDYCGWDFGMILYTASLKLWIFCMLLVSILLPHANFSLNGAGLGTMVLTIAGIFVVAVIVGVVESVIARLRLTRVPQLIIGAGALASLALLLSIRGYS